MRLGALALGASLAACAHAAPSALTAPAAPNAPVSAAEDDALSHRLEAYEAVLAARGFKPAAFQARGFLPPAERTTFAVRVEPGRCALFVAIASANVGDLDAARPLMRVQFPDGAARPIENVHLKDKPTRG